MDTDELNDELSGLAVRLSNNDTFIARVSNLAREVSMEQGAGIIDRVYSDVIRLDDRITDIETGIIEDAPTFDNERFKNNVTEIVMNVLKNVGLVNEDFNIYHPQEVDDSDFNRIVI